VRRFIRSPRQRGRVRDIGPVIETASATISRCAMTRPSPRRAKPAT
jgi:hypothetical protein